MSEANLGMSEVIERIYNGGELTEIFPDAEPLVQNAYNKMKFYHCHQRRKGRLERPYFQHPFMVFALVRLSGGTVLEQIAALLHDAPEDAHKSHPNLTRQEVFNQISADFGDDPEELVKYLTNKEGLLLEGKENFQMEQLEHFPGIRLIKLSDKVLNVYDNLSDAPPDWSGEKLIGQYDTMVRMVNHYFTEMPPFFQEFFNHVKAMGAKHYE